MASNRKIMVLPGDGIGNEVMQANMKLIDWLAKHRSIAFDISEGLVGGAAFDVHGTPLTDETLADSMAIESASVSSVNGVPCTSKAAPPTSPSDMSKAMLRCFASQSISFILACITSLPIPSPGKTIILRLDAIFFSLNLRLCKRQAIYNHGWF